MVVSDTIILMSIMMIGLAFAIGGLTDTSKTKIISDKDLTDIKTNLNLDSKSTVIIDVSKITCDDSVCKAKIFYPNLINTEWVVNKKYCNTLVEDKCTEWKDYTASQLETMRDNYVVLRLKDYLNNKNTNSTDVVGEGKITLGVQK